MRLAGGAGEAREEGAGRADPVAEAWQRCLAAACVWIGSDTDESSPLKALDVEGKLRELGLRQEGNGGKGGVENLAQGGHLQRTLMKSPSGSTSQGRAKQVQGVYPLRVASVLMSESYDQAGKPLWLLLWLCF